MPLIQTLYESRLSAHHLHGEEEIAVAEDYGAEGDGEAEAEEELHVGLVVVFIICSVPVWPTGALHALRDVPVGFSISHQVTHITIHHLGSIFTIITSCLVIQQCLVQKYQVLRWWAGKVIMEV